MQLRKLKTTHTKARGKPAQPSQARTEVSEPAEDTRVELSFRPSHPQQLDAIYCLQNSAISFLTGPPGTAKTHVSTYHAIKRLLDPADRVRRIYLTRPAVTQGAEIGFLPGDADAKMNPFLRPIINSFSKLLRYDAGMIATLERSLEVLPLSYIRGWTFEDSVLLVDEAQNLQGKEIKTIMTRLGRGGQVIFTGDCTQGDLHQSVIEEAAYDFAGIERSGRKIGWFKFTRDACVRDPLVSAVDEMCEGFPWAN